MEHGKAVDNETEMHLLWRLSLYQIAPIAGLDSLTVNPFI